MPADVSSGKILAALETWSSSCVTCLWQHEQMALAAAMTQSYADVCDALEIEIVGGTRTQIDALMTGPAILPLCSR